MALKVEKSTDFQESKIKAMIYGQSGVGKTVLMASLSDEEVLTPMLIVDLEAGLNSAIAMGKKKFDKVSLSSTETLMDDIGDIIKLGLSGKYKTIVIDSITELQNKVNDYVKLNSKEKDPFIMTLSDWGKSTSLMRYILRKLRDLPCNIFFSALLNTDKDETTGQITYSPMLTPKLRENTQGYMDIVGLMIVKDNKRMLYTSSSEKFSAKDRFNAIGNAEATSKLFSKIIKGGK